MTATKPSETTPARELPTLKRMAAHWPCSHCGGKEWELSESKDGVAAFCAGCGRFFAYLPPEGDSNNNQRRPRRAR